MSDAATAITFRNKTGQHFTVAADRVNSHPYIIAQTRQLQTQFKHSGLLGILAALSVVTLLLLVFYRRVGKHKKKIISGGSLKNAREVARMMRKAGVTSQLMIGNCPIPIEDETQHFLLHGTTGTGKSQAIQQILRQLRSQGKRAIIYDKGGRVAGKVLSPGSRYSAQPAGCTRPVMVIMDGMSARKRL